MFRLLRLNLTLTLLIAGSLAYAAKPLEERVTFTTPFNVQTVVLQKTIAVSWQWMKPDALEAMKDFGFDVRRGDGKTFFSKATAYQDEKLTPGLYSYAVRVRGRIKEKGKWVLLTSEWSETVRAKVVDVCPAAPHVELQVTPTQKTYSSIPSLRFRLQGQVVMDKACTLSGAKYLLDTGRGIMHTGPLKVDAQGRYDVFVNALGPEDEIPAGVASFSVSVTAENEVGPSTSDVYTLDVALQNPYAPH